MLCHLAKKVLFAILIIYNANSTLPVVYARILREIVIRFLKIQLKFCQLLLMIFSIYSVYHFSRSSQTFGPQRISYSFLSAVGQKKWLQCCKETHTNALIALKDGQLVYEKYCTHSPNFSHPVYSVTKSLTVSSLEQIY